MGKQLISGVAGQTGQPADKTGDVLSMAMPLLLGAMKKNVSTPQGAQGLMSGPVRGGKGVLINQQPRDSQAVKSSTSSSGLKSNPKKKKKEQPSSKPEPVEKKDSTKSSAETSQPPSSKKKKKRPVR